MLKYNICSLMAGLWVVMDLSTISRLHDETKGDAKRLLWVRYGIKSVLIKGQNLLVPNLKLLKTKVNKGVR